MKTIQFNVKTYDNEGNIVDNDDYYSIADIQRNYPQLSYNSIHYIANYHETIPRKPSKKILRIMKQFEVTPVNGVSAIIQKYKK